MVSALGDNIASLHAYGKGFPGIERNDPLMYSDGHHHAIWRNDWRSRPVVMPLWVEVKMQGYVSSMWKTEVQNAFDELAGPKPLVTFLLFEASMPRSATAPHW